VAQQTATSIAGTSHGNFKSETTLKSKNCQSL
jgi:hypothetical protein